MRPLVTFGVGSQIIKKGASEVRRIDWIDNLRGFGILMVILGHSTSPFHPYIYSFHMPLFFILSGFLWTDKILDTNSFGQFVVKKTKSLILPYFKVAVVCLFLWGIITPPLRANFDSIVYIESLKRYLFGIVYSIGSEQFLPECSPIWFLTALFCSNIYMYTIRRFCKHWIILFLVLILGYVLTYVTRLPWNMNSAVVGVFFMLIGFYIHELELHKNKGAILVGCFILLGVGVYLLKKTPFVDMDTNEYSNYWFFIICALIICYMLIVLFASIRWNKLYNVLLGFFSINAIAFFGYDYSARKIVSFIPGIDGHWLLLFGAKVFFLIVFVLITKKIKINNYLY